MCTSSQISIGKIGSLIETLGIVTTPRPRGTTIQDGGELVERRVSYTAEKRYWQRKGQDYTKYAYNASNHMVYAA